MLRLRRFRPLVLGALAAFLAACLVPLSPTSCSAGPLGETYKDKRKDEQKDNQSGGGTHSEDRDSGCDEEGDDPLGDLAADLFGELLKSVAQGIGQAIDPRGTNVQIDTFAARAADARSIGLSARTDIPVRGIVGMTVGLMGTSEGMLLTQYGIRCSLIGYAKGPVHIAAMFGHQVVSDPRGWYMNPAWRVWDVPLRGITMDLALGRRAALQTMVLQSGGRGGFQHLETVLALGGVNEAQFRVGYRKMSLGGEPGFEGLFVGVGTRMNTLKR